MKNKLQGNLLNAVLANNRNKKQGPSLYLLSNEESLTEDTAFKLSS